MGKGERTTLDKERYNFGSSWGWQCSFPMLGNEEAASTTHPQGVLGGFIQGWFIFFSCSEAHRTSRMKQSIWHLFLEGSSSHPLAFVTSPTWRLSLSGVPPTHGQPGSFHLGGWDERPVRSGYVFTRGRLAASVRCFQASRGYGNNAIHAVPEPGRNTTIWSTAVRHLRL